MIQDLRFYSLYTILSSSVNYGLGRLMVTPQSPFSIAFPVLEIAYGMLQTLAYKGVSLLPSTRYKGEILSILVTRISTYLFSSTCIFAVSQMIHMPLTFKAALLTGLNFECFGGMLLLTACLTFAVVITALHNLEIINGIAVKDALRKWTRDKQGNTVLLYTLMEAHLPHIEPLA